jgi:hypothetical protein
MLADGGDCLSDLAGLGEQARLFGRVCSTATAWRVVHEVAADPRGMAALWSALARVRARAWRMRSSSRVNGRNRCSAMSAGTTAPVLTTRRTDVASWVIVEISMVPPATLSRSALSSRLLTSRSSSTPSPVTGAWWSVVIVVMPSAVRPSSASSATAARSSGSVSVRAWSLREYQQCLDEPLGVIDGLADFGGYRHQLVAGRLRLGEHDVDGGAHEGQRRAQLMACVGDELPLAGERAVEPFEHRVEGVGELTQLVAPFCRAMRWDRFCSLAARAAAVSRCTGRRMRPATIQPATAASSVTPARLSSE